MRRLSLCMWTILALLILVSSGSGQERYPATTNSWMPRFLQFKRPPASKKTAPQTVTATPPQPAPIPAVMMMNPKTAEALRQTEQDKLTRRLKVCDELRAIAMQTGDRELQRKADYLDQRAFESYLKRTGQALPLDSPVAVHTEGSIIDEYLRNTQRGAFPNFSNPNLEQRIRANVEEQP